MRLTVITLSLLTFLVPAVALAQSDMSEQDTAEYIVNGLIDNTIYEFRGDNYLDQRVEYNPPLFHFHYTRDPIDPFWATQSYDLTIDLRYVDYIYIQETSGTNGVFVRCQEYDCITGYIYNHYTSGNIQKSEQVAWSQGSMYLVTGLQASRRLNNAFRHLLTFASEAPNDPFD